MNAARQFNGIECKQRASRWWWRGPRGGATTLTVADLGHRARSKVADPREPRRSNIKSLAKQHIFAVVVFLQRMRVVVVVCQSVQAGMCQHRNNENKLLPKMATAIHYESKIMRYKGRRRDR